MFKKLSNTSKQREDGQGLVEYALILVLVSVVVVVVLSQMGPAVGNIFSGVVGALNGASEPPEEECLWDTNVYFRFPSGADKISQPFNRYSDSNCETNEVQIPAGDAQYMLRRSAYPDASAACTSLLGYPSNINDPGPSSDVVWCR